MGLHIVVIGDLIDGFSFVGVFQTGDDAFAWARRHLVPQEIEFRIAPLESQHKWEKHTD
jgi:hypothetical protein